MDRDEILEIDRKHIWHPFTQMKDYERKSPIIITRGKGIFLFDDAGNRYYDTISSWWVNALGHCNERINNAAIKQLNLLEHVNFSGFTHPYATNLIKELKPLVPEIFTRFFFSDNGSTAVEVAIKMAFQYFHNNQKKEKRHFVMLNNSYHGDTLGATSVGAVEVYHAIYKPLMFDTIKVAAPYETPRTNEFTFDGKSEPYNPLCFEPMREALIKNHKTIAAVIIEPIIQGAGGMMVYHPQYLNDLRTLCDELDILIIADEVATGFGRTGKTFAFQHAENFTPDIFAVSKALTAGYMPLSLTITTEKIYNAFYGDFMATFFHGHSYTANPLACSIATETMKIFKEENIPASKKQVIAHFHKRLREFASFDFVGDIRYCGFFGAIDLVKSRKEKKSYDNPREVTAAIYDNSFKHGVVLRPLGNVIYWCLPLIVTKEDIDQIIDRSIATIKDVVNKYE